MEISECQNLESLPEEMKQMRNLEELKIVASTKIASKMLQKAMEFGEGGEVMKKRMSFGLSVADEKIKLIDILSEDDYFLVASPLSDHSLQASLPEVERIKQKEQESRPSFLRRSLAWDSAFSNDAGVLDPDELSLINNGFIPANHEIRNRRSESKKNDAGFSPDWFHIEAKSSEELNVIERSPKSELNQNFQSSLKFDKSCKDKIKFDHTSIGKSSNVQSKGKMKKESAPRRPDSKKLSDKSVRTGFAKLSSTFSSTAAAASSFLKRKTDSKKSESSASVATSKISRLAEKKKGVGNISASTLSTSVVNQKFLSPPAKVTRVTVDSNDVKEASSLLNRHNPLSSTKSSIRPSGLRPPSPHLRYFDEGTDYRLERNRKVPQKVISEDTSRSRSTKKYKNPKLGSGKNINRLATRDQQIGKKELNCSVDQLDELCRNFEAVELDSKKIVFKQEKKSPMASSSWRTPLAEKTSNCNFSRASMEPKKETKSFLRRASSVRYGLL